MTVAEAAAAIDAATLTMHSGRATAEALIAKQEPIPQDYVLRTRRDMTYAQHQVQRAVEKLVEVCGARSVYDADTARPDPTRHSDGADPQHRQPAGGDGRWGSWALSLIISLDQPVHLAGLFHVRQVADAIQHMHLSPAMRPRRHARRE